VTGPTATWNWGIDAPAIRPGRGPRPAYARNGPSSEQAAEADARPKAVGFVHEDEFTADRRMSVAPAWHQAGGHRPSAGLGQKANNTHPNN
jgi:hypothetical protein